MEITRHHRFNRRIVALVLFLLIALGYVVVTLFAAPAEHNPALGAQSAIFLISHESESPRAGPTPVATPSAQDVMDPARRAHQP